MSTFHLIAMQLGYPGIKTRGRQINIFHSWFCQQHNTKWLINDMLCIMGSAIRDAESQLPCRISYLLRIIKVPSWRSYEVFCIFFCDLISIGDSIKSLVLPRRSFFILSHGHPSHHYHISNDCTPPVLKWQKSPSAGFTAKHYMWAWKRSITWQNLSHQKCFRQN